MADPREIEAKFDIDPADRELLLTATAIGRFAVQERRTVIQDDIYYDTIENALANAGSTLRIRRTGKGARMTFKGQREVVGDDEAHIATRLEDEVSLDDGQVAAVSDDSPLPELDHVSPLLRVRDIVGDAALYPVARLQNTRTAMLLVDHYGATLELAVDDCVGIRLRDRRATRFDEVELETKSADRSALVETSEELRRLIPSLKPSSTTKLGRTLT